MISHEDRIIDAMYTTTWRFYAWIALLCAVIAAGVVGYVIQIRDGLIITGLRDQVSWGLYIATFVFWVGVSKGGTMISAILRITKTAWRTPLTRLAEAITVFALLAGVPMIIADLGRPDRILNLFRYGRIQSPLIWDLISVNTYFVACALYFYLPLIPDLAILAVHPRTPPWRRRLYRALSLRWRNTDQQKELLERAIHVMAIAVIPLAVSVHTVVSWIFAMTLRPGWNSTIFGPYFVVGAIYSGAAAVIVAMLVLRRVFRLEAHIEPRHFRSLGALLLAATLVYFYFNVSEYLTVGYKLEGFERELVENLFRGHFARLFWTAQIFGVIVPSLLMAAGLGLRKLHRYSVSIVGVSAVLIVIGAWIKRFLIVVPTLETPFLPAQRIPAEWKSYTPTSTEWLIVLGALAAFLLGYTLVAKLFPIVSLWETRHGAAEEQPQREHAAPSAPHVPAVMAMLAVVMLIAIPASAQTDEEEAATAEPTRIGKLELGTKTLATEPEEPLPHDDHFENPFVIRRAKPNQQVVPAVSVTATFRDETGQPVPFKPIVFRVPARFGIVELGTRPTDDNGVATITIKDRRFGRYDVLAVFEGDEEFIATEAKTSMLLAERPPAQLPAEGILISPRATPKIALPFFLFFGGMWLTLLYVADVVFRRLPRA